MFCYFCHAGIVVTWGIFLLIAIKITQFDLNEAKKYFSYALGIMFLVLASGIKLIMLNPFAIKSGGWLHTKLLIVFMLMLENVYFYFKPKKLKEWVVFVNVGLFLAILALTFLRPF